jgi:hypothetical protein
MNDERIATQAGHVTIAAGEAALNTDERWRLTLYKWRYSLESQGFSAEQARRLLFLRWLHGKRPTAVC